MALFGALIGCASTPDEIPRTDIASAVSLAEAYHLDSGDRLRITVFRHLDLSGEFVLDGSGNLAMPLIGEVQGGGRTLRDLESQIETAFSEGGFLVNPQVGVEVLSYRPFYILGEVNQPGSYPYVNGMTGITAVAMAGGFTNRARQSGMSVQRRGEDGRRSMGLASTVLPGDILNIEERFF
ncbi:MAG: polysaccharide export protein [Rhizobiales bacterium]|nr:polysaccharide export protein [Hyphomicrobiales bacterium]